MNRRAGNALVEAGLVLPIVIFLVMAIFEAGRAWMDYNLLQNAVREGARFAAIRPALRINDAAVLGRIDSVLQLGGMRASSGAVLYTTPLQTGRLVRVRATINFVPLVSILFRSGTIPLQTEVITRYEV
jgi:hypothetical protein